MKRFVLGLFCAFACIADDYSDAALKRAEESVQTATDKAAKDQSRPVYHFLPPAQWMNDPNGPIFHNGYYHVFYQHNPYADTWGHMHWGHARSKDLVHWEHLAIALWPSEDKGEAHVFSGCATINGDGVPMLFYTSVSTADKKRPNEQWAAIGDADLIKWEKHPKNPILDTKSLPFEIGPHWRDPFVFHANGRTFLVCGADTKEEAIIPIFEADTPQLDKWTYKGIVYRQPKSAVQFFECPNFFPLDGKWVLIFSPYKPLRYMIGSFDMEQFTFTPEKESTLDYGTFYASNIYFRTDAPRDSVDYRPAVLVGWIRGFKDGLGWNGCMSLPRTLSIGSDGFLRQLPIRALDTTKDIKGPKMGKSSDHSTEITTTSISKQEMAVRVSYEGSVVVTMTPRTPGVAPVQYKIRCDGIQVDDIEAKWNDASYPKSIAAICYIDKTVFELTCSTYTNDAANTSGTLNVSKVIEFSPDGYDVRVENLGESKVMHAAFGNTKSIWGD